MLLIRGVVRCVPEMTAKIAPTQRARAALRGLSVLARRPEGAGILFVNIGANESCLGPAAFDRTLRRDKVQVGVALSIGKNHDGHIAVRSALR